MASALLFFAIIVALASFIWLYMGEDNALASQDITVITHNGMVEKHLTAYKQLIGDDYDGYRNHIYRVLSYSMHFLKSKGDSHKYLDIIAAALVYHDIGLWTDSTLAYLRPSCNAARQNLRAFFDKDELKLQEDIIYWHHKITPFEVKGDTDAEKQAKTGSINYREYQDVVEAVRRGDWIDATNALLNMQMPRKHIVKVKSAIPAAGFYQTLAGFGPKLYGHDIFKIIKKISTIYKW